MDMWMDVDAAVTVPVNLLPLLDDTDFKTRETGLTYNQAGLELIWNFVTTAGAQTHTAVTPTNTGGDYDWVNIGHGMYNIEIPASGGASINNDTEGFGWFTGYATGVLPWRGPVIGFRAAALNNALIDNAWSTTRGLAGTALPDAAADAAGGLVISDAGGLDIDAKLTNAVPTAATVADAVWDEARADHTTAGSFGEVETSADIADAVWDEARADHVAAGSFGQGAASVQGNVTGSVGSVTGAVGSVTGAVGSVTGAVGSVTAEVSANVKKINDVTLTGNGTTTPWGPA